VGGELHRGLTKAFPISVDAAFEYLAETEERWLDLEKSGEIDNVQEHAATKHCLREADCKWNRRCILRHNQQFATCPHIVL